MYEASLEYEKSNYPKYAINCLKIVQPYFTHQSGWNSLQTQSLIEFSLKTKFIQKRVYLIKTLLELSPKIQDIPEQQKCIEGCKKALSLIQDANSPELQLANLKLPIIKTHLVRVFTESESISCFDL